MKPVVGQLPHPGTRIDPAQLFEDLGHPPVRPGPPGRPQVLVQDVLDERMTKRVMPRSVGNLPDDRGSARCVEKIDQLVFVSPCDPAQVRELEVPPDDRCDAEDPRGILAEARHVGGDHFLEAARERGRHGSFRGPVPAAARGGIRF